MFKKLIKLTMVLSSTWHVVGDRPIQIFRYIKKNTSIHFHFTWPSGKVSLWSELNRRSVQNFLRNSDNALHRTSNARLLLSSKNIRKRYTKANWWYDLLSYPTNTHTVATPFLSIVCRAAEDSPTSWSFNLFCGLQFSSLYGLEWFPLL